MKKAVRRWHDKLDVQLVDFWANEVLEKELQKDCTKGCSACCTERVFLTPTELVMIAQRLKKHLSRGSFSRMQRKVARLSKLVESEGREEWWRNSRPCPLLKDNECSVYSSRPLACRGRHSLDRKTCEVDSPEGSKCLTGPTMMEMAISADAMVETAQNGYNNAPVELIVGLDEALNGNGMDTWLRKGHGFPRAVAIVEKQIQLDMNDGTVDLLTLSEEMANEGSGPGGERVARERGAHNRTPQVDGREG